MLINIKINSESFLSHLESWIGNIQAHQMAFQQERMTHSVDFLENYIHQNLPAEIAEKLSVVQQNEVVQIVAEDPNILHEYANNIDQAYAELEQLIAEEEDTSGGEDE